MNFVAATSFGIYVVCGSLLYIALSNIRWNWETGYFAAMFALNFVSLMKILIFDPQTIFELADIKKVSKATELQTIPQSNNTNDMNA